MRALGCGGRVYYGSYTYNAFVCTHKVLVSTMCLIVNVTKCLYLQWFPAS